MKGAIHSAHLIYISLCEYIYINIRVIYIYTYLEPKWPLLMNIYIYRFQVYDIYRSLYMNISINTSNLFVFGFGKVVRKKSPPIKKHSRVRNPKCFRLGFHQEIPGWVKGWGAWLFFPSFCKHGHERFCRCQQKSTYTCKFETFYSQSFFSAERDDIIYIVAYIFEINDM